MAVSTWEPSELDKQTQIAQQALACIAGLEADRALKAEAIHDLVDRAEQAEAALAERDTYLAKWQWIATHDAEPGRPVIVNRPAKRVLVLSNLYRARAEEGGGT